MAEYASKQAMDDIEALLTLAYRCGEWNTDIEAMLGRWRAARGEAGLTAWRWWAKAAGDDEYANELATREEAIAWARREYPGKAIIIVEAQCFADEIEGDEISLFADVRNLEQIAPEARAVSDLSLINAAAVSQHTRKIIGPTILMGDGLYFDFAKPCAIGMTVEDYAWGLASNNRFRGQTRLRNSDGTSGSRCLYNVCQHVVLLADQMWRDGHPLEAVYQGLMHESDEVPWPDIAGPAKPLMHPETRALIKRSGDAIDLWFGVGTNFKDLVKKYDIRMLATEKRDLMPHAADKWGMTLGYEPFCFEITPWDAEYSVERFLGLYEAIGGAKL